MEPSELELYTAQELITELMRRKTFFGVVVHSDQELKSGHWSGARLFKMHYSAHLEADEAGRLLGVVAEHVERREQ